MDCISRDKCQRRQRRRPQIGPQIAGWKRELETKRTEAASNDLCKQQQQLKANCRNSIRSNDSLIGTDSEQLMTIRTEFMTNRRTWRRRRMIMLLASCLLAALSIASHPNPISCQLSSQVASMPLDLNAENRAVDSSLNSRPNSFDQLLTMLQQSYQQQPPNRRPQMPPIQRAQVSTPMNPFLATNQQFPAGLPQNRRIQFPTSQQQQGNQLPLASSSPATPYLTLNRLASLAGQQQQQIRPQNQFNQPPNAIPLGGQPVNRPQLQLQQQRPQQQHQQQQPQRPNQQQQFGNQQQSLGGQARAQSTPLPLPPLVGSGSGQQQQVKPLTGFAPSGPPPSSSANNAMVVVPSPPNAIGLPLLPPASSAPNAQQQAEFASTSTSTTTTTATPLGLNETAGSANETSVATTTTAATTTTTTTAAQTSAPGKPPAEAQAGDGSEPLATSGGPQLVWNPVEANRTGQAKADSVSDRSRPKPTLAPSPDIVTVPPDYNPDNPRPQNYDISVSAQMGGQAKPVLVSQLTDSLQPTPSLPNGALADPQATISTSLRHSSGALGPSERVQQAEAIAPTAVTTIIWSPPPPTVISETSIRASPVNQQQQPQTSAAASGARNRDQAAPSDSTPNRVSAEQPTAPTSGVVYGRPQARDSKPTAPPSPTRQQNEPGAETAANGASGGRPYIQSVQLDNQVRPFAAGSNQPLASNQLKSNHAGRFKAGAGKPQQPLHVGSGFTISSPNGGNQTMPTGDIQDYLAAQPPLLVPPTGSGGQLAGSFRVGGSGGQDSIEPTISAQGGQDPASFDLSVQDSSAIAATASAAQQRNSSTGGPYHADASGSGSGSGGQAAAPTTTYQAPRIRRPIFKPKPAVPPIRIDSCIVGDDSSCDQSHNERCVTEYGISSCHCKPGFARLSQLRGFCSPVSQLQLSMKIERLSDDRKLVFNHTLEDSNSEEYQYLEFETIQALASAFQQTQSLAKQFMGARVNKFFERKGKVWANLSINLELTNLTKTQERIQALAAQELNRVVVVGAAGQTPAKMSQKLQPLGDSSIVLDGTRESLSKLVDINECASKDLNDCSKFATCTNDFGGFQCQCQPGYEDRYGQEQDRSKHGRSCMGCSANYCSNRGECVISEGQKQCKCRPNFIGARCDIDSEVLVVAVGGSLVGIVILIITFWCLYIFNRRWNREQQKMDAVSATSGLTFNYVNQATSQQQSAASSQRQSGLLMSPATRAIVGGLQRSAGAGQLISSNYGPRFRVGGQHNHYATSDQQAIIGSTSSGSSAASQPIGCNPYNTTGYQYEDVATAAGGGLLIAPASTGSSEQTSPTGNSYRGIMTSHNNHHHHLQHHHQLQVAGNAYTLSGHHHHHHHHQLQPGQHYGAGSGLYAANKTSHHHHQLTQFHPAADYNRTLNPYDARWRTLQQQSVQQSENKSMVGYYLSPDMLIGNQVQQQLYASPQRELCIDTGGHQRQNRKQQGRTSSSGLTMRSRSQGQLNATSTNRNSSSIYHASDAIYDHHHHNERPI